MSWTRGAALVAASAVFALFAFAAAQRFGANYEEVVAYVLAPLDIRDFDAPSQLTADPPRFVTSPWLPKLAFEPAAGVRWPLLNQLYMTDHLSYGGVALGTLLGDRLGGARLWHIASGLILVWLLHDITLLLGFSGRAALLAAAIAATAIQLTTMYMWARFDESLASWGSVVVLWAALRYDRSGGQRRWLWVGVTAAALAITGKITALWILGALGVAAWMAGWQPPPRRALARPALAVLPLFLPMVGFAIAGPATGSEIGRRLSFITDLFTTDVVPGTAANLVNYLGNWGGILSYIMRGAEVRPPNLLGLLLVSGALLWLIACTLAPGPVPRRRRREAQMLAVVGVIFALVTLFFREHRDYQFALLVPLHAIGLAAFLDRVAARVLDPLLPAVAAGLMIAAVPVAANLWDQRGLHADLDAPRNALVDLGVQRASAAWLVDHGVEQPIVVTFYAVGTYELLTANAVRPIYAYPLFRFSRSQNPSTAPDPAAAWRTLLAGGRGEPRYAVLPLGENPVEGRHFDEPGIRRALLEVAPDAERVAVFESPAGEPLLEVWRIAR